MKLDYMKRNKTITKLLAILIAVTMAFSLTACGVSQDNLDSAVTPLSEQITTINTTLTEMQTLDTTLDGYIDTLESKVTTLETDLTAVNTTLESLEENSATKTALWETKTTLETEINAIKTDITALKAKDAELDGKITELQTALSTEITDTKTWIEETFGTKTACDTLKTEINTSIATLQGKIDGLETSIETLNTAVTALQTQVEENTNKIEELEIRINCLEGKHVTETFYYTYTWSETAPTSIKNSPCIHCEKIIEETVSPGVWTVGDKVTYIAKDGNSYVSTVGEVTDGKAVLVSDNDYSKKVKSEESALLALLEPVGARFPRTSETIYTTIIEPWLMEAIEWDERKNGGLAQSFGYVEKYSANRYLYKAKISDGNFYISNGVIGLGGVQAATWIYRYVWDVEFTTAE